MVAVYDDDYPDDESSYPYIESAQGSIVGVERPRRPFNPHLDSEALPREIDISGSDNDDEKYEYEYAEPEQKREKRNFTKSLGLRERRAILAFLIVLLVSAIVVVVASVRKNNNSSDSEPSTTNNPGSDTEEEEGLITVVLQLDSFPEETGWTLACETQDVLKIPSGFYKDARPNTLVRVLVEVREQDTCILSVFDEGGDGINDGYLNVYHGVVTDESSTTSRTAGAIPILMIDGNFTSIARGIFKVAEPYSTPEPTISETNSTPQVIVSLSPPPSVLSTTSLPPSTSPPQDMTISPSPLPTILPTQFPTLMPTLPYLLFTFQNEKSGACLTHGRNLRIETGASCYDDDDNPIVWEFHVLPQTNVFSNVDGWLRMQVNDDEYKCLTIHDPDSDVRTHGVVLNDCQEDNANYLWTLVPTQLPGLVHVVNVGIEKCLDLCSACENPLVSADPCINDHTEQAFALATAGSLPLEVQIENEQSQECLTWDENKGEINHDEVAFVISPFGNCERERRTVWELRTDNSFETYGWLRTRMDDETYQCLTIVAPTTSTNDTAAPEWYHTSLNPCGWVSPQQYQSWSFEETNGMYMIRNLGVDMCLGYCVLCDDPIVTVAPCSEENTFQRFTLDPL